MKISQFRRALYCNDIWCDLLKQYLKHTGINSELLAETPDNILKAGQKKDNHFWKEALDALVQVSKVFHSTNKQQALLQNPFGRRPLSFRLTFATFHQNAFCAIVQLCARSPSQSHQSQIIPQRSLSFAISIFPPSFSKENFYFLNLSFAISQVCNLAVTDLVLLLA